MYHWYPGTSPILYPHYTLYQHASVTIKTAIRNLAIYFIREDSKVEKKYVKYNLCYLEQKKTEEIDL